MDFRQRVLSQSSAHDIVPSLDLHIDTKNYTVSLARSYKELYQALRLRHDIFSPIIDQDRLDIDQFDDDSDHLIVTDKKSGTVIGNYRMRHSQKHQTFYSETEFSMQDFLKIQDIKVELGRACVHPDFRSSFVIPLLWRGMTTYMRLLNARFLFGCSSVPLPAPIASLWQYLSQNDYVHNEYRAVPFHSYEQVAEGVVSLDMFPSLFLSYLKSGAKVLGPPAYDELFKCVDFLTLLDAEKLSHHRAKRFSIS